MGKNKISNIAQTRRALRLQTKLGIAFSILAVFIAALLTFASYLNFRAKAREDIRRRLNDIVGVAVCVPCTQSTTYMDHNAVAGVPPAQLAGHVPYVTPVKFRMQLNGAPLTSYLNHGPFAECWKASQ